MIKEKENSLLVPSIRLVNPGHLSRVDQLRAAVQDIVSLEGTENEAETTALDKFVFAGWGEAAIQ